MEVQPVVKHNSADEWVEGESQSADEMREEHYPLLGLRGGDDLPFGRKLVRDVGGQVSGLPKLRTSCREPTQGLVLCRIELPQIEGPLLAGENPANEHDLDHVDKLKLLVHQYLETGLESGQFFKPQATPFSCQEVSRMGTPDRNSGVAA